MSLLEVFKYIVLTLLVCNTVAVLAGIGRALLAASRTMGAKKFKVTIFPVLGILFLLGIVGVNAGMWFAYGVAHSGKKLSTDVLLVGFTCVSVSASVYGLWKLSQYIERRLLESAGAR